MLRMRLLAGLPIALSLAAPLPASAETAPAGNIHSYAPTKHPRLPITGRDNLPFVLKGPYPTHGVLLGQGSFISPSARWTIIDFDSGMMTILQTTTRVSPNGPPEAVISGKSVARLQATELNEIIDGANLVWNPPPAPQPAPPMVTDVTCDLVLFDGSEIVRDWGPACRSVQLVDRIEAIGRRRRE